MLSFIPAFHMMTRYANPALADASERTPVMVVADPADCSLQFDPVGKAAFTSSCDIAKSTLANAGVSYRNEAALAGLDRLRPGRIGDGPVGRRGGPAASRVRQGPGRRRGPHQGGAEGRRLSREGRPGAR